MDMVCKEQGNVCITEFGIDIRALDTITSRALGVDGET
jgi:hypothetical protein